MRTSFKIVSVILGISILTLQNTLIMVNAAEGDSSMLTLTAITSGVIMLAVLLLSIAAFVNGSWSNKEEA